jgi:cobalt-zinc-cadmium efflux system outer membrane protein
MLVLGIASGDRARQPSVFQRREWFLTMLYRSLRWFVLNVLLLTVVCQPLGVLAETNAESQAAPQEKMVKSVEGLTLANVLALVDSRNPQLQAARQQLGIRQAEIRIAGQVPNPQLNAYYGFGKQTTQLGNPQQFGVTQTLETAGKRRKRVDVARAQQRLTEAELDNLRWTIRSQVRQSYLSLAEQEALQLLVRNQMRLLDQLVDVAQKRVQAGAAPEAELLQARLARSNLDTRLTQVIGDIRQAKIELNALLGNTLPEDFQIADWGLANPAGQETELVPMMVETLPPKDPLLEAAFKQRQDLAAALHRVDLRRQELRLQRAQRVPDVQLAAGYLFSDPPSGPTGERTFYGGEYVSANMTVPVFHNQQNEIRRAEILSLQAGLEAEALRLQIRAELDKAYNSLVVARANILRYQTELLPSAQEVLNLAELSYRYGKTGLTSFILTEQTVQQVRSDYLDALIAYQNAWGELERATGGPLQP